MELQQKKDKKSINHLCCSHCDPSLEWLEHFFFFSFQKKSQLCCVSRS